jgi:hypothetical protein
VRTYLLRTIAAYVTFLLGLFAVHFVWPPLPNPNSIRVDRILDPSLCALFADSSLYDGSSVGFPARFGQDPLRKTGYLHTDGCGELLAVGGCDAGPKCAVLYAFTAKNEMYTADVYVTGRFEAGSPTDNHSVFRISEISMMKHSPKIPSFDEPRSRDSSPCVADDAEVHFVDRPRGSGCRHGRGTRRLCLPSENK